MSILRLSLPSSMERQLDFAVKERGFQNKTELLKFAVMQYLHFFVSSPENEEEIRTARLTDELRAVLTRKGFGRGTLPSLREQLDRI